MSEKSTFDWSDQIKQYQQAYFDAWQAFLPGETSGNGNAKENGGCENPWVDAMNSWWKNVSPDASEPVHDFYERMVDQGKAFLEIANKFNSAMHDIQDGSHHTSTQWQDFIEQATKNFQSVFSNSAWQMPLSNWQHVLSSMSFLPGDALQGFDISGLDLAQDNLRGNLEKMLSTPGIGQTREKQEQQQKLAKLILEYQAAMQEYVEAQSEIGFLSIGKFQEQLTEIASSPEAESLTSFKEVFDCWVDCCEAVYAEYVMTEKYITVHGKVVNTLMAVKQQGRMMVDEVLGAFNMPTRREIDTLHCRFHEIHRSEKSRAQSFETFKNELTALVETQAQQIEKLQAQLRTAQGTSGSHQPATKATAKKAASPKTTSTSKRGTSKAKATRLPTKTKRAS